MENLQQRLERHKQLMIELREKTPPPARVLKAPPIVKEVWDPEEDVATSMRTGTWTTRKKKLPIDYSRKASVPILNSRKGYPRNAIKGMLRRR